MKKNEQNISDVEERKNWIIAALHLIINIKLGWLLTVLFLISIILYSASYFLAQSFISQLLRLFADACLSSSIIGFGYEWLIRKQSNEALSMQIKERLSDQQILYLKGLEDVIPRTLLLNPDVQKVLLVTHEKIDEIMRGALSARLGDKEMAASLYDGILKETLHYNEYFSDVKYDIILCNPDLSEPEEMRKEFFDVTINIRYRTKLKNHRFIFTRIVNNDQFNKRVSNPDYIFMFRVRETPFLPRDSDKALKIVDFKIDDYDMIPKNRINPDGAYEIVFENPELINHLDKDVNVFYSIQTKLTRLGHVFFNNAIRPTRNVTISFEWAQTDIEMVRVYDFFISANRPRIYQTPQINPHCAIVELNGWTFPKGGAVFVWRLKGESNLLDKNGNQNE